MFAIFLSGGVENLVLILHFTAKKKYIAKIIFSSAVQTSDCKEQWRLQHMNHRNFSKMSTKVGVASTRKSVPIPQFGDFRGKEIFKRN